MKKHNFTSKANGSGVQQYGSTRSVTLKDVAKLANVSAMTVSRALTRPELVSLKTISLVVSAVEQTGFISNSLAGGLTSRRTKLIAAIVPTIAHSLFSDMVQSMIDALEREGYQTMLGLSRYDSRQEEALVKAILSRRPDGIALTGIEHTAQTTKLIRQSRVPVVELWDHTQSPLDSAIGFSHEDVGCAAYKFLIQRYRRPVAIRTDDGRARKRAQGFIQAAADLGHATPVDIVISENVPQSQRGRETLTLLRSLAPDADAVFCSSDAMAQSVLASAHSLGWGVPDKLAILGFGDQSLSTDTIPALSTIRVDGTRIGTLAAEHLLRRIQYPNVSVQCSVDVGFEMITRASA